MLIHKRDRFEDVAEVLTHLATIFIQDMAEAENALIGAFIEDKSSDSHQGVEPAASLIDRFADKVGRISSFELLNRSWFVRVAPLRKWHCTRVVPAVDNFRNTIHGGRTFSASK